MPRADEVLVRVEAVGICGSDMQAYHGHDTHRPPPLILGHEAAGRIAGPRAGERVNGGVPSAPAAEPSMTVLRVIAIRTRPIRPR